MRTKVTERLGIDFPIFALLGACEVLLPPRSLDVGDSSRGLQRVTARRPTCS